MALLHEVVHRRAVGQLPAVQLGRGVRMRVEVDEPDRLPEMARARAYVGLGDRVVAAEHDRQRAGGEHFGDRVLDGSVGANWIGRDDGRVPEVDDPEMVGPVDLRLEVVPRGRGRRSNRPRAEPRSREIRDELVERCSHDGDVDVGQLRRVLGVGEVGEGGQPRPHGLVAEPVMAPPARDRVDHAANPRCARE